MIERSFRPELFMPPGCTRWAGVLSGGEQEARIGVSRDFPKGLRE